MLAISSVLALQVGSLAGLLGIPFRSVYCSTKFALEAFNDALRFEMLPFEVSVSLIEPGYVQTPILGKKPTYDITPEQRDLYWVSLVFASCLFFPSVFHFGTSSLGLSPSQTHIAHTHTHTHTHTHIHTHTHAHTHTHILLALLTNVSCIIFCILFLSAAVL